MRQADVTVSDAAFEEIGIRELIDLTRSAGLQDLTELACHGTSAVVQVTVDARIDETQLDALDWVDEWTHVAETATGHCYVISFTAPGLPDSLRETADGLIGTCDPDIDEAQASMSLVGPHETIAETIAEYESAGVAPSLRRLRTYEGGSDPADALTTRQREVLETAFDMGYYAVPREATAEEVAAELGLDDSTVVEHLQRAERNVLEQVLE